MVPQIQGRETKIERLKGSTNANEATNLNYYLGRYHSSVRIPPAFFGYVIQGSQPYDPQKNLSQQDDRYAKIPAKLQRYYLLGMHRILQLNLAFKGVDPTLEENSFTLAMAPVTYLGELHRQQLIEVRIDIIDRLLNMGKEVGFDMQVWVRYVLKQYGKLSDRLIEELLINAPMQAEGEPGMPPPPEAPGDAGMPPEPGMEGEPTEGPGMAPDVPELPVGGQPMTGDEFESLPAKVKKMLTELAQRVADTHKIVEDCRVDTRHAMKFFYRDRSQLTEVLKLTIEDEAGESVGVMKDLREEKQRSEDLTDLLPPEDEDDEDE